MAREIGGVTVANSSSVRWATLVTVVLGGPAYALNIMQIRFVDLVGAIIRAPIDGLGWFVTELTRGWFDGIATAIGRAWSSFLADTIATFGVLSYPFVVVVVAFLASAILWAVSKVR